MAEPTKRKLRITTSWDDGHVLDMYLASLLKTYNIPATFYIPSNCGLEPQHIRNLDGLGFEIGGHTVTHPSDMKLLGPEQLKFEIEENKRLLESIIRKPIAKFCYPRGRYNAEVIKAVEAAKYREARTTAVFYTPKEEDIVALYEMGTTVHVYQRSEYERKSWQEVAAIYAGWCAEMGGLFHLWGHSWEIDRDNEWNNLEAFFRLLNNEYEFIIN